MPTLKDLKHNPLYIFGYISGYIDGEGCFSVSFSKRKKIKIGWETKPSLSVSQNEDRAQILYLMREIFGCGFLRRDYSDKTLKYEIRSLNDLTNKVIPFFDKYPLISKKKKEFEKFRKICFLMMNGKHLTKNGFKRITKIAFEMNPSGKRKYSLKEILKSLR
ncbi:MAG: endonuclease [Parcubacteria group bacterium]|nr:endonuclease [Parcubacteria group bacterium]